MCSSGMPMVLRIVFMVMVLGHAFASPYALAQTPLPIRIGYQQTSDWLLLAARDLKLFEKARWRLPM